MSWIRSIRTTFVVVATAFASLGVATLPAAASAPGDPNGIWAAVPGNQQVTLGWYAPTSDGGSSITSYTVTSNPSSDGCTWTSSSPVIDSTYHASDPGCIVTGLTGGVTYTFTIVANNADGSSTGITTNVTPVSVPTAPQDVTATAGTNQATVSWNPPSSDGGSVITSYTATANPDGATCSYTVSSPETDTCTITGLVGGYAYTFTVVAYNAIGASVPSDASSEANVVSVPGQSAGYTGALPGDGYVTLGWYAPLSNGGSTITSYTVTATPGGATCTWHPGDPALIAFHPSDPSCTVTGLVNGTTYRFDVVATNAIGNSESLSTSVAPEGPPSAPSNVTVLGQWADGSAKIQWDPSTSDGGSPMTSYLITASPGGATCSTSGYWNQCTVRGLTPGTSYTFSAQGVNALGTSAASSASAAITKNGPAVAPTGVIVTKGKDTATVHWTAVSGTANLGYSTMRGYIVSASPGYQQCYTTGAAKTSCIVRGLVPGVQYRFTVAAWTMAGLGLDSAQTAAIRLGNVPGAPTAIKASSSGSGKVLVTWQAPASNGGVTITSYLVTASGGAGTCTTTGLVHQCEITGLTVGAKLTFAVTGTNLIGTSPSRSSKAFKVI